MPAAAKTPQDRKPPAKRAAARKSTPAEMRAASERALAAKAAEDAPVSGADNDALRVEAVGPPPERPEGLPALVPGLDLSRRLRAEYYRALDVVFRKSGSPEVARLAQDDDSSVVTRVALSLEMAADVEDVLRIVAVDAAEFDAWARSAPDDALIAGLNWYQAAEGNRSASPV